ncbi:uncharacterized protein CMU_012900 [Cryptosporidium muris RN66]|uniref:Prefoldin subunit family protein n=1 Tax=Cryptosporidium muris (strain RN66) TaxID=441375 RepID=B6AEJ9_CRYMR|nr:uncharacterized protein CMU_012900 [Cryptosporidium muris RN66]EEA06616.1 hypothetical protein, conserved [Cryptosporidium muris RN66]|eukprot:XP_002140965.1 hypothetical protein [Cryptosporidium muris RN66]
MNLESNDITKYENFLEKVLQKDLKQLIDKRQEILIKINEIQRLRRNISLFSAMKLSELNTSIDLGCDVYIQANIPDITMVFVELAFGFFLELKLDEIPYILDLKEDLEYMKLDILNDKIATIKARIKVFSEAISFLSFN